ncbi:MAG: NUDIX domain-containing protein, partial [Gammaproteobacteria bacterium]|nr:NUDIX domain-containing protein [Gammaproteobacteria bacterium]
MSRPVTPAIAVDAIIEMSDRPGSPIVLIERRNPPHGWAIPGGFVDVGETLEAAVIREAKEETSLDITL